MVERNRGQDQLIQQIQGEFLASAGVLAKTAAQSSSQIAAAAQMLITCLAAGNKILVFGNGGSAADAQHLVAELVGRFSHERAALPALALTSDTALLTALGNDYGFEHIFARQVEALVKPGDVVIGISTSGRSPNVLVGLRRACDLGAGTIALLGQNPGALSNLVDQLITVPGRETARIQEAHAVIIHCLCKIIEETLSTQIAQSEELDS